MMDDDPRISGYQIVQQLGSGGMATVYLGIQEKLNRKVAIKILSPHLHVDKQFATRFMREAETAANLYHSNIISIHDVGQEGSLYYIVMEYLKENLKIRIVSQTISPKEALELLKRILPALQYAHEKGVVHRDIKPDNIMFRFDGTPVLVDFGIAKAMDSSSQLTATGISIGTPHYMSPEQCRGERIDGRSDIYSLGVVLFEMLVGSVPYEAENTVGVVLKHIQEPVPALPVELLKYQRLINYMMDKNRELRAPSAGAVLELLERYTDSGDFNYVQSNKVSTGIKDFTEGPLNVHDSVMFERKPRKHFAEGVNRIDKSISRGEAKSSKKLMIGVLTTLLVAVVAGLITTLDNRNRRQPSREITPAKTAQSSANQSVRQIPSTESRSREQAPESRIVDSQYDKRNKEYEDLLLVAARSIRNSEYAEANKHIEKALQIKSTQEALDLKRQVDSALAELKRRRQLELEKEKALQAQMADNTAFSQAQQIGTITALRSYIDKHPSGRHAESAENLIREITKKEELIALQNRIVVQLRSQSRSLSESDVRSMVINRGLFESKLNPGGRVVNDYAQVMRNNQSVIIDYATGLMWHPDGSDDYLEYENAKSWIYSLNSRRYAGYSDWRLPTLEEALSLVSPSRYGGELFIDTRFSQRQKWIWTSDPVVGATGKAWVVLFTNGTAGRINPTIFGFFFYVRPVRTEIVKPSQN